MQLKFFLRLCFLSSKKGHNNVLIASLLWCDNTTYILQRGDGEKNICSTSQSTFLVPASNPADCKWTPDSASYHGIKKASKQAWHKKLITTLVFRATTSGSLPDFAGWSQVSHKTSGGGGQPRQLQPLISPAQPLPRMPRALGRWQPPASTCGLPDAPGCPAGWWDCGNPRQLISGVLAGQEQAALPLQRHVFQPPVPRLEQAGAGRSKPAGRRRRSGTEPWQEQLWASHHPRQGVRPAQPRRPTRRWRHSKGALPSETKSWAPQVVGDKRGATSKCCWCKAEKLQTRPL